MVDRIRAEFQRITSGRSGDRRMSQAELDAYRRQLILFGISVTAILLVVILAAGAYYQYIHLPRQTVAVAGDTDIRRSDYWTFRRYELLNQINQYQQFAQFVGGEQAQQYQQLAFQASQEFRDVEDASIDAFTLNEMIDNIIIMDALDEFGIEITDQDVDDFLVQYFTGRSISGEDPGPTADPTAEAWATATAEAVPDQSDLEIDITEGDDALGDDATDDAVEPDDADEQDDQDAVEVEPTPTPEPTPSEEELRATATSIQDQHERNLLDEVGMSHDEFVELIVKPQIAREKIRQHVGDEVPTRAEQVRAAHILVATEEAARLIHEELVGDDPRDFAEAAGAQSTDVQTAPNGGDLGWFPRGVMVQEFDQVAFETSVDEISEPFQTEFGWHIVKVLEHDEDRPVEISLLQQLRQRAFQDWLEERRASVEIDTRGVTLPDDAAAPPMQFQPPASAPPAPQPDPPPMQEPQDDIESWDGEDFDDLFPDDDPFEDLDDDE
jgi:parvulin-like peptidyl-prolyl isomerase